ncbi:flagellar basal body P-ring formation chaperone FlgA [bacterium]|nr:flagellar basal body P-ring formation chaperone FlgA [bacterium]
MNLRSFVVTVFIIIVSTSQISTADVSANDIRQQVTRYMLTHMERVKREYSDASRYEYHIQSLDSRLKMSDCAAPLDMNIKSSQSIGRVSVQVSCKEGKTWSIYVPIEVSVYSQIVTTTTPLNRGTLIQASDLTLQERPINRIYGAYFNRIEDVIGYQTKRNLQADHPISSGHIEEPLMVKRGDAVVVEVNVGTLKVKSPGVALKDGRRGEQIRVRNNQSKRVVDAQITAPGRVEVMM